MTKTENKKFNKLMELRYKDNVSFLKKSAMYANGNKITPKNT
ncbi:MAG: hypothetical protein UV83_C0001G0091 [candidate division WWE3 bacterium GW2011_GWE2_43_18]|nr:MAG: hypothetical protein UU91_C0001G0063 [candidate division WWE3 bacterium GW2011_GWB1_42_117]KKT05773.1 MAG: hypothetical protein UV83_C0001G0091 [candidate division WWE3 bacterium GW2011_GWE2_43_18]KKT07337.1 MAG: hypothetical protein UV84_C0001G0173 [candidate division WWE3 bacterium GW2011_GWF2_43_18]KKT10952.1 MAG: hypothetical protein UV90_C0002G0115 [candidate division WWE3 bacterium GW2011_GWA2_43_24]KKT27747.1 MAG: hypothetical protein UW13_C0001G0103 [candidate division WWE3 bact